MHKKIQDNINIHLNCIREYEATEEDLIFCETLFSPNEVYSSVSSVYISWIAKGMDEVKKRLAILAKNGILLTQFNPSDDNPTWRLKGKNADIYLIPHWCTDKAEGATCRLIQVGERMRSPEPIFKLVCDKDEVEDSQ